MIFRSWLFAFIIFFSALLHAAPMCRDLFDESQQPKIEQTLRERVAAVVKPITENEALQKINSANKKFWEASRALAFGLPTPREWKHLQGVRAHLLYVRNVIYNWLVRPLSPLPLPKARSDIAKLFEKMTNNPGYVSSQEEKDLLIQFDVNDQLVKAQDFGDKHKKKIIFGRAIGIGLLVTYWAQSVAAYNVAVETMKGGIYTPESYFSERVNPTNSNGDHQVEILAETTPFPHVALQVGNQVYSYGVKTMTISPVQEYLGRSTEQADPNANSALRAAEKVSRSVQVMTLNLTPDEVQQLTRDLNLAKNKDYNNITWVNDCSSMVFRALRRHSNIEMPTTIDPSPGNVIMYLAALKDLGAKNNQQQQLVDSISQIDFSPSGSSVGRTLGNVWINRIEGSLYLGNLIFMAPLRWQMDIQHQMHQIFSPQTTDELARNDDQQQWSAQAQAELAKFEQDAQLNVDNYAEITLIKTMIQNGHKDAKTKEFTEYYFNKYISEAKQQMASPDIQLETYKVLEYTIQILEQQKAQFLAQLS